MTSKFEPMLLSVKRTLQFHIITCAHCTYSYSSLCTKCPKTLTKGISNPAATQLAIIYHLPVHPGGRSRAFNFAKRSKTKEIYKKKDKTKQVWYSCPP